MKPFSNKKSGFTLVELLVVIAIIAVVASLGLTVGFKVIRKGKAATMVSNMKQIAPMFSAYANDHGGELLPCRSSQMQPDGTFADILWHEVLLMELYPEANPTEFKTELWWKVNPNFLRNPLFEEAASPRGRTPENPGYGYNIMLPANYLLTRDGSSPGQETLEATGVPMSVIDEPARTPLIAPCDNYFYSYDPAEIAGFDNGTLADFLDSGKFPVLFVDGHIEMTRPDEYISKRLYLMPGQDTVSEP